ncbi:hypothetical protein HOD75_04860 [archaeon]|nr:hypothetical protein [archaeon]MBT4242195.1 hypothetical protein [archaeon]
MGIGFNKKSQHEIIGFVMIVVIVSVIGLIFLGFSITQGGGIGNSAEISNLLEASMYSTTNCSTTFIPEYKSNQDLIKEVYKNPSKPCLDGRSVSEALEISLDTIFKLGLDVSSEGVNKAYKLGIYANNYTDEILVKEEGVFGNCSSIIGGSHTILATTIGSDNIDVGLEVCR